MAMTTTYLPKVRFGRASAPGWRGQVAARVRDSIKRTRAGLLGVIWPE